MLLPQLLDWLLIPAVPLPSSKASAQLSPRQVIVSVTHRKPSPPLKVPCACGSPSTDWTGQRALGGRASRGHVHIPEGPGRRPFVLLCMAPLQDTHWQRWAHLWHHLCQEKVPSPPRASAEVFPEDTSPWQGCCHRQQEAQAATGRATAAVSHYAQPWTEVLLLMHRKAVAGLESSVPKPWQATPGKILAMLCGSLHP